MQPQLRGKKGSRLNSTIGLARCGGKPHPVDPWCCQFEIQSLNAVAAETVSAALLYLASDLDSGQGIRVPEELMPSNASLCLGAV